MALTKFIYTKNAALRATLHVVLRIGHRRTRKLRDVTEISDAAALLSADAPHLDTKWAVPHPAPNAFSAPCVPNKRKERVGR